MEAYQTTAVLLERPPRPAQHPGHVRQPGTREVRADPRVGESTSPAPTGKRGAFLGGVTVATEETAHARLSDHKRIGPGGEWTREKFINTTRGPVPQETANSHCAYCVPDWTIDDLEIVSLTGPSTI